MSAFLRTGARAALMLEDDVELAPDLTGVLGSNDWWPHRAVRVVKLVTSNQPSRAVLLRRPIGRTPCGRDIQPIALGHSSAGAYVIDRAGAELFLAYAPYLSMTADSVMFSRVRSSLARLLNACVVNPAVARPRFEDSDIGAEHERSRHRAVPRWARLAHRGRVFVERVAGAARWTEVPYRDESLGSPGLGGAHSVRGDSCGRGC